MHLAVQLITYDLHRPGQNYHRISEAIQALGSWWHCLGSVWIVKTALTSTQVRDYLSSHLDANDSLLVAGLSGGWGTSGIGTDCTSWLNTNLSR